MGSILRMILILHGANMFYLSLPPEPALRVCLELKFSALIGALGSKGIKGHRCLASAKEILYLVQPSLAEVGN